MKLDPRRHAQHAPVKPRERAGDLADLLARTLRSYRCSLEQHDYCGSCDTDLQVLEAKARALGIETREVAT